jgi:hypothetical protein
MTTSEPPPAGSGEDVVAATPDVAAGAWHRAQAVDANNSIWQLLEQVDRSPDEDEDLLRRAYAAAYHWQRAAGGSRRTRSAPAT